MEHLQINKALDALKEGQMPTLPTQEIHQTMDELRKATTEELEQMLQDPAFGTPENAAVRDEVVRILTERCGSDHVSRVVEDAKRRGHVWSFLPQENRPDQDKNKSAAERAKEAFKAYNNPLINLIAEDIKNFVIDTTGVFFLEFKETSQKQMKDFDLVVGQFVTGRMETNRIERLSGIKASKDVYGQRVELNFLDMMVNGSIVVVTTDHPMANKLQIPLDDFMTLS